MIMACRTSSASRTRSATTASSVRLLLAMLPVTQQCCKCRADVAVLAQARWWPCSTSPAWFVPYFVSFTTLCAWWQQCMLVQEICTWAHGVRFISDAAFFGHACSATSRRACRAARRWLSWRTAPTTSRRSPGARAYLQHNAALLAFLCLQVPCLTNPTGGCEPASHVAVIFARARCSISSCLLGPRIHAFILCCGLWVSR